jgi:hypothetical protein
MYKGISRKEYGTNSENARLDEWFDTHALRISQATLEIASRASCIAEVVDRSVAKTNEKHSHFLF